LLDCPVMDTTIHFTKDKETKNTIRFSENAPSEDQKVRTIYLTKSLVEQFGNPERIKVTITPD